MFSETVELRGHIIDSLILPKVLDEILTRGAGFKIAEIKVGQNRVDQSYARIEVSASSEETLAEMLLRLRQHGAEVIERADVQLAPAPADGVFPENFYVTTNQQTFVQIAGKEVSVESPMIDSAIAVSADKRSARSVKFYDIHEGDIVVVGQQGIRVEPVQRDTDRTSIFQFNATVSAEMPKTATIREVAREMQRVRQRKGKILVVAGPSLVHTGAGDHLEKLISLGFVQRLFTGNGLAVYDIESALYGTSLGVNLKGGALVEAGHENHMHAINRIRQAGGIQAAVDQKIVTRGIMHACVRQGVDIVLSGSIRDDGPIPGVTTDALEAQRIMRDKLRDLTLVLMMGSMLHSLAVANMVPPSVKIVCVDIDPRAVARLTSRQTFRAVGLVTDIEPFLRELTQQLEHPDATSSGVSAS
ncbi:MAG: TIGR00300 family protein [Chthoniobacterales bacterium]|nr:TIGR00300 family protein [Chthoniobacterales bacterium]